MIDIVTVDIMYDGMMLKLSEDYTGSFDKLVYDIIDCSDGVVLQRLGDVVLFTVAAKEFDRIYAILCNMSTIILINSQQFHQLLYGKGHN